ncbi:MAG TPA: methylated-DNA--[protein]-cysteine S-methyltransferase [bacterium]|nr:methylated-DNA--[protein]-cysteine S-methyltransferase [bacterium]
METPIGILTLVSSEAGLFAVRLPGEGELRELRRKYPGHGWIEDASRNGEAVRQLRGYFDGSRTDFDLPLDLRVTPFQKQVLERVRGVPHGGKKSYGEIAREIGKPEAARAVGMANRNNPLPIVVPCHRIVGADGSLTGYGGGLALKAKLLEMEKSRR